MVFMPVSYTHLDVYKRQENNDFDAEALLADLTYTVEMHDDEIGDFMAAKTDFMVKEYNRMQNNSTSAILVIGAIYVAVVFVFLAMAVLALKTLAGISEDKRKYEILFRLGAGEHEPVSYTHLDVYKRQA